jgi:hypothetical protein
MFLADNGLLMWGLELNRNLMDQVLKALEQNWLRGDAVFSLVIVIRSVE